MRAYIVLLVFVSACASVRSELRDDLQLRLQMERIQDSAGQFHPIAVLELTNVGISTRAVTTTFGFEVGFGLGIEDSTSGRHVAASFEGDLFDKDPGFECLAPGESRTMRIDLLEWRPVMNGNEAEGRVERFYLYPGTYRVTGVYSAFLARSAKCAFVPGEVISNVVEFEF